MYNDIILYVHLIQFVYGERYETLYLTIYNRLFMNHLQLVLLDFKMERKLTSHKKITEYSPHGYDIFLWLVKWVFIILLL